MAAKCLILLLLLFVAICQCLSAGHMKESDDKITVLLDRQRRFPKENEECARKIAQSGMDLINYGMKYIDPTIEHIDGFYNALAQLYKTMLDKGNKKFVISGKLRERYPEAAKEFLSAYRFEDALVYLYTTNLIYPELNKALREHDCTHKTLSAKDRSLAPYAAALMATMMHWKKIKPVSKTSYRSVNLKDAVIDHYKVGDSFLWPSFSSSSTSKNIFKLFPGNVHFIINNEGPSSFRPRDIKKYSEIPKEDEVLYPACATFRVTAKSYNTKIKAWEIYLTLLQGLEM